VQGGRDHASEDGVDQTHVHFSHGAKGSKDVFKLPKRVNDIVTLQARLHDIFICFLFANQHRCWKALHFTSTSDFFVLQDFEAASFPHKETCIAWMCTSRLGPTVTVTAHTLTSTSGAMSRHLPCVTLIVSTRSRLTFMRL
jgi:hypothetical protein